MAKASVKSRKTSKKVTKKRNTALVSSFRGAVGSKLLKPAYSTVLRYHKDASETGSYDIYANTSTGTVWVNNAVTINGFSLSLFPSAAALTNVFDQYRIRKVKVTYTPSFNVGTATSPNSNIPLLTWRTDLDGASGLFPNPPVEADMLHTDNAQRVLMDRPRSFTFVPRVAPELYKTSITTAYAVPDKPMWIDCADNTTPHYGWAHWLSGVSFTGGGFAAPGYKISDYWYCQVHIEAIVDFRNRLT